MSCNIGCVFFHTPELEDIEEGIINTYTLLFEEYGRSIFYENDQSHGQKNW
jgi:hypothetical protein